MRSQSILHPPDKKQVKKRNSSHNDHGEWGYLITKVTATGECLTPISVLKKMFEMNPEENAIENSSLGIIASKELVTGLCGGISFENV